MEIRINNKDYLASGTAEAIISALLPIQTLKAEPIPLSATGQQDPDAFDLLIIDQPQPPVIPAPIVITSKPKKPDTTVIQWLFPDGSGRWLLRVLGATKPTLTVDGQDVPLNDGGEERDHVVYPYFGFFKSGKQRVAVSLTQGSDTYTGMLDLRETKEQAAPLSFMGTTTPSTDDTFQTASVNAQPLTHVRFARLIPILNS